MRLLRVRFNDSLFVLHNSSGSFHEPYFSRKPFTNNPERAEHKIMVLKAADKCQVIWQ